MDKRRSRRRPLKPGKEPAIRERVGAYIKTRRAFLGMTSQRMAVMLGYHQSGPIPQIELGLRPVPRKRIHEFAVVLKVGRRAFEKFVAGLAPTMPFDEEMTQQLKDRQQKPLTPDEHDLLLTYRNLSPEYRRRVLSEVAEFLHLQDLRSKKRRRQRPDPG